MILRRICQLSLTRITHQVSRAFDLNPYAKPKDNNMYIPEIISRKINGVEKDEIDIMEKLAFKEVQELMNGENQEIDYHGCDHFFLMDFVKIGRAHV